MEISGPAKNAHPEAGEGEIFYGYFNRAEFSKLPWETKREGQLVFDEDGRIVGQGGMMLEAKRFPVFIQRSERESKRRALFVVTYPSQETAENTSEGASQQ